MDFSQVAAEFQRLKAQYDAGMLSEADFKAQLQDLMIQDEQGRWWMIGAETGQWYVHNGEKWERGEPLTAQRPAVMPSDISDSPRPTEPRADPVKKNEKQVAGRSRPGCGKITLRLVVTIGALLVVTGISVWGLWQGTLTAKPRPTPASLLAQPATAVLASPIPTLKPSTATPTLTSRPPTATPTPTAVQDTIRIASVLPAPGVSLKTGQTTEFAVSLKYTLSSVDKAILALYVEEYPESAKGCTGSTHQTNGGTHVPLGRGEGDTVVRVKWTRDPSGLGAKDIITSGAGFVSLGASLWSDENGRPDKWIQDFGLTGYCYAFTTQDTVTQDTVRIISALPNVHTTLKSGQTTTFRFMLHYNLVSRDQALLFVSIAQFDDTPSKCKATGGELVEANSVAIKRGEGDVALEVKWLVGDRGKGRSSSTGFAAPAPSLWEGDRSDRIEYYGVFPDFCYSFAP